MTSHTNIEFDESSSSGHQLPVAQAPVSPAEEGTMHTLPVFKKQDWRGSLEVQGYDGF